MKVKIFNKLSIACSIGLILTLLSAAPLFAGLGKIAGTVTDAETGDPLPGASVQISGTLMGAATDAEGQYFILNVPPGSYVLKVAYMGYATQEIENVRSQLDVTTTVNIKLKPTVIEGETVSVVAERPVIDKTMTATKVAFSDQVIDNVLPVAELNAILQTSVTTQSMRGANKSGVDYMVDGVKITDPYFAVGGGSQGYSMVKRDDTPLDNATGQFENQAAVSTRKSGMVNTSVNVAQTMAQEVNVIAGTFNAEYSASGGVVNVASKSGSKAYTAKLHLRSSLGGLDHVGPNIYSEKPPKGEFADKTAAQHYLDYRKDLVDTGEEINLELAKLMDWKSGKYEYGDDPRMNAELYVGGPLTDNGNFFLSGTFLNDHGRFPGEFQRKIGASLKINYNLTDSDKLTVMGSVEDGGKLLGWKNRQYTYMYSFFLEGQPVNEKLGLFGYLKHNHVFDASSFLETTISYVGNQRTYGYCPVNGKLKYDDYGDFIILDKYDKARKYIVDEETRIFDAKAGNNQLYQVDDFGNQIRFGLAGYSYEDFSSGDLTIQSHFTKQMNFNHQLKAGAEYKLYNINQFSHNVSAGSYDSDFPYVGVEFDVSPWSFGTYIQDRIEYEGIIVNAGIRMDGYNMDAKILSDLFDPAQIDSTSYGRKYAGTKGEEDPETHIYFSPRLGVSHPISENAAMHYSWGIYTTQPVMNTWLTDYGTFANVSWPHYYDSDTDPERAVAYEIGVNVALSADFGADLTAYYRDTRNASETSYLITPQGAPFAFYSYHTSWGYRDSRGIELNLWKRPSERYFGVVGVSGNLSLSFSYDASSANASTLANVPPQTSLNAGSQDEDYDFDTRYTWPTYTRAYDDWNMKLLLLLDFPYEVNLSTITTYRSPWRYRKTLDVTNTRYEEMLDGDDYLRVDLRLIKYVKFAGIRAGVFFEALNVLDNENILSYDVHNNSTYYEEGKGPWGPLNRPVDQWGNPYADIARELYAGFEISFE
ncbi:carboxypeptidase-like regulatory domain-containing protein [candidate division KSB1 bacterium]|nr:carboxypeptidase-like regulatory domain-containing protein [candidate division KSB1 bacterium]